MSDLPLSLPAALDPAFVDALDPPGKLVAALEALGPVADRDVLIVDASGGPFVRALEAAGARVTHAPAGRPLKLAAADGSADVVIGLWSAFRGLAPNETAEVDRVLRPGGRHLVVHEYGRDDVSRLLGERPEYGTWSRRNGPFLKDGFKIRVVHCFWTFDSIEDGRDFLGAAFGEVGRLVGAEMTRPRLSYNLAVYHRTFEGPNGA